MEASWDHPKLRKYAETLVARLERPRLPERAPSRATRSAEWFILRVGVAEETDAPIRERFDRPTGDIPARLKTAMMECQKPFHLWNVNRIVEGGPPRMEQLPPYIVGHLEKPETEGLPGRVTGATKLLPGAAEEVALVRSDAFGAKRRLHRMLMESAEEQGLGVPEPLEGEEPFAPPPDDEG